MKTAIVYASVHHGNTKKIIDEIAKTNDVELIDATQTVEKDLSEYDLICFASGVYGGKFHQSVLKFASVNLTDNKNVFSKLSFYKLNSKKPAGCKRLAFSYNKFQYVQNYSSRFR